jgi:hypothetical protein
LIFSSLDIILFIFGKENIISVSFKSRQTD